ncbi:hypothetical protein ACHWQZ_G018441 [Mnemiopsis leidyi]
MQNLIKGTSLDKAQAVINQGDKIDSTSDSEVLKRHGRVEGDINSQRKAQQAPEIATRRKRGKSSVLSKPPCLTVIDSVWTSRETS